MPYIFQITCADCALPGPASTTKALSRQDASDAGWLTVRGLKALCPACRAGFDAKRNARTAKAPRGDEAGQTYLEAIRAKSKAREDTAISMRESGATWAAIGRALSVTHSGAKHIHERGLKRRATPHKHAATVTDRSLPSDGLRRRMRMVAKRRWPWAQYPFAKDLAEAIAQLSKREFSRDIQWNSRYVREAEEYLSSFGLVFRE